MNNKRVIFVEPDVVVGDVVVKILAAGPLTAQPGSAIFRVVLAVRDNFIVVWSQRFERDDDESPVRHTGFDSGDYFLPEELAKATAKFAARIKADSACYASVYRE